MKPRNAANELTCELVHNERYWCSFEAISYEWGVPSEEDPEIIINKHAVRIRKNLYLALQQFRHGSEERILWVDAICINQSDIVEKGIAVQLMGTIYQAAAAVLVWLGPENEDTSLAYDTLSRVLHKFSKTSAVGNPQDSEMLDERDAASSQGQFEEESREVIISDYELEALVRLMECSYWYRVWIVQEVCLARRLLFYCGKYHDEGLMEKLCDSLARWPDLTSSHDGKWDRFVDLNESQCMKILLMRRRRVTNYSAFITDNPLLSFLRTCENSHCSEKKDYVFAFVPLDPLCRIVVDYDISPKLLVKQIRKLEKVHDAYLRYGYASIATRRKLLGESSEAFMRLRRLGMELEYLGLRCFTPVYRFARSNKSPRVK